MHQVQVLRGWLGRRPLIADGLLALLVFGLAVTIEPPQDPRALPALSFSTVAPLALSCSALVLRRRLPVPVWLATTLLGMAGILIAQGPSQAVIPIFVALYTVGAWTPRRVAVRATLGTGLAFVAAWTVTDRTWLTPTTYAVLAWGAMGTAVGVAVRGQRAVLAASEERARQAEHTREEEAQRRVAEERLRIARELHDVVAHHIAVINVQAGVASHLLQNYPDQAREALAHVRASSQVALSEMATLVGLLRAPTGAEPRGPTPGLAEADALVESVRRAGLTITWRVEGAPRELPPGVDFTAYRLIQESLTNAHKHGLGTAEATLAYLPDSLSIAVSNPVGPGPAGQAGRSGHGLVGIRERVAVSGGVLRAGLTNDGQFLVQVELPTGPALSESHDAIDSITRGAST